MLTTALYPGACFEAALQKWGYEVVIACDGAEAWDLLQREDAPRLAILDWMMPGLSGPEVCRRVRQYASEYYIYILLLTSRNHKEDLVEGMEAGADDYITKPFDQHELNVRLGPGRRIVELQDALLEAQAALREQATMDALTKIWNRRSIFEILNKELSRAHREDYPVAVALGDLDRFKSVNDTYGHIAGDGVLRQTAQRMVNSCRKYDSLGRYGGEEFLLVLPGCDASAAEKQVQRLRREIENPPLELPEGVCEVTISLGVTSLPKNVETDAEALIRIADKALYKAKEQGRNRVVYLPFEV